MLRVFDAEAAVAGAVLPHHAVEDFQLGGDGPIPDRVHDHVKSGLVRPRCPRVQFLRRRDKQAGVPGSIGERVEHGRRMGA
jgi:hypothetical protein